MAAFEWTPLPPPTPKPPKTDWEKFKAFVKDCMDQQVQISQLRANDYANLGNNLSSAMQHVLTTHRDDGVGVALDVLGVALSLALLPTGLGLVGAAALLGGSALLYMDGKAYAMEMSGDEAAANAYKRKTESRRLLATLITLPDIAYGGFKAVRELQEISELRVLDRTTGAAAEKLGARTQNAQRAQQYAQIAERANLKAQIRTQQIMGSLKFEVTPRVGGVGSAALLVREEIMEDHSMLNNFMARLRVHTVAVHR